MYHPEKVTPATIEFLDIAGLVKGASKGEGLGNKFLSHIREVDAILQVVRCFEEGNIVHVEGSIDPIRDVEIINMELIFADLETVEKRMDKTRNMAKSGEKKYLAELEVFEKIKSGLEEGRPVRALSFNKEEKIIVDQLFLLTQKPVIYVANISENDLMAGTAENQWAKELKSYAAKENAEVMLISATIEEEIAQLDEEDKRIFLSDLGLAESGLDRLVKASYKLLGLISFLTAGPPIISDFERGFIKAEIIGYEELMACGSYTIAKEKGLVRLEGKDYIMKDGDVTIFRFNV